MIGAIIAILALLGIIAAVHSNYDALCVLRASALQASGDTETGTGIELGPTDVVKAICHVTVVESGGTLAPHLEGSETLDGTYYDIPGGVFLDPTDGAIIDAVGQYEIYVKTDFEFIRVVGVVATADVTWECFLAVAD
ncbi:MAG: hypothetical protein KAR42_16745 [candidate division Zixibacteria bacterium]|nr:hypothetical protein [candidate division Zixibacteria bacterium]